MIRRSPHRVRILRAALVALLGLALALALVAPLALSGCASTSGARREQARAAVLATAEGLRVADRACAALSIVKQDRELALACASGYDVGRAGVLATAGAVDAWDQPSERARLACSLAAALGGLEQIAAAMQTAEGALSQARPPSRACRAEVDRRWGVRP